jgi:predicted HD superfamily hydrolase involved in NAD metabolism
MEQKQALAIVKEQLTEHRYIHTIGVMETAVKLAKRLGEDKKKAETAAIFHDYAKFRPKKEMKKIVQEQNLGDEFLHYGKELLHAPVGAYLVRAEVGIEDPAILNAIRYHTTGRPNMTQLEKIVFIADYIEPNRAFVGVEEVRELVKEDLDLACILTLKQTMIFLLKKKVTIYPGTLATYNELISKNNGR